MLDVNKKDGIVDLSLLARLAVGKRDKAQKAGAELAVRAAHPRRRVESLACKLWCLG